MLEKLKENLIKKEDIHKRLSPKVLNICKQFDVEPDLIDWETELQQSKDYKDKISFIIDLVKNYSALSSADKVIKEAELRKENIKKTEQAKAEQVDAQNEQLRQAEEQRILDSYKSNFNDGEISTPKFENIKANLRLLGKGLTNAVFIYGSFGTGKSYITIQYLKKFNLNFEEIDYIPTFQLIKKLWELRGKDVVLVFHEAETLWKNPETSKLLRRIIENKMVAYETSSKLLQGITIPFEVKGVRFVFLSNKPLEDKALLSRMLKANVEPNLKEMLLMIEQISKNPSKTSIGSKLTPEQRKEVLDFIKDNASISTNELSLRVFENGCIYYNGGEKWKELLLSNDLDVSPIKSLIKELHSSQLSQNEQISEFTKKTGFHRSTFFKVKGQMGLCQKYTVTVV